MHHVSDQLSERYPYRSGFREEKDPHEVSRAYGGADIARFCWLLSPDEPLADGARVDAMTALADLLSSPENKTKAIAAGIVPSCGRLLTFESPRVKAAAATVVAALAWDLDGLQALHADPTLLYNLNHLLFESDTSCAEAALQAFVNVTTAKAGIDIVLGRHYIPEKLVLMASGDDPLSPRATLLLFHAFANLTKAAHGAEVCTTCHIVPALLKVVRKPLHFELAVLRFAVLALWNLGTHNFGKIEAIGSNAVELSTKVLVGLQAGAIPCTDRPDLLRCLAGALMALATNEAAKPKLLHVAVQPLVACLYEPAAAANAAQALNYMAEAPDGLLPIVTLLLDDTDMLMRVFGLRALPALSTLLAQQLRPARVLAALARLAPLEGAVAAMTQCLHLFEHLARLCVPNDDAPELAAAAARVLQTVADDGPRAAMRVERAFAACAITDAAVLASVIPRDK
ncbi:flagellar radial spoke protein [Achlya hypogyna]|uniref:Flagellar radial spoke protein n=1 Tax=Achlya hypogyna TaxID=1202772 RepID=A0A1V9Z5C3_ACHHY|nr:flagellar radial spoke protein [Achlya hypogyna]